MKSNHFTSVLRYARRLAERSDAPALRDCELLARYVVHKDEDAFSVLLQRHGSMVWGVCKRVLDDPNDADDAGQATFLVLLNKSATLLGRESLASWLQGTAWRLARKVKVQAARRRTKEVRHIVSPTPDIQEAILGRDLRSVLDKEIARLPADFRDPLILCYLQGKSYAEAARQLGWPEGTVSGRLARARALLRQRLTRRGMALSPTALVVPGWETAAPAASIRAVERTAHLYLIGQAAVSSSNAVAGLTRSLLTLLKLSKLKMLMAGIVLSCASVAGVGLATHLLTGGEATQARDETPEVAQADIEPMPVVTSKGPKDFYGDPLPLGALARIGSAQLRHAGANLVFSADGRNLISASNDMLLYWDVTSGKLARRLPVPNVNGKGSYSYLSLDGKTFVICAKDRSAVCVYDASTMRELHRYSTDNEYAAALSADGKLLVLQSASESGSESGSVDVRLLDLTTGKERARLAKVVSYWGGIKLSNDGKLLASTDMGGTTILWDTDSGRELGRIPAGGLNWELSPDGKLVASAEGDGTVTLWETSGPKRVAVLKPIPAVIEDSAKPVTFSPDGSLLAVGGMGAAVIWDVAARKEIARLPDQHRERLNFSSDNKTIASQGASRFRLWDVGADKPLHKRIEYDSPLTSLAVSPDGARIATIGSGDSFIGMWEGTTGQPLHPIAISKSWPSRCSFSADGRMLIVSGSHNGLVLLDVGTGKVVREFKNTDERTGNSALAVDAYLSKDKKRLTVLNRCWNEQPDLTHPRVYHQLAAWDVDTGKSILQRPFDPNEFTAGFSGDGMTVTGIAGNRLKTEETLTGRERLNLPGNLCEPFALSPRGYLAAAGVRPAESKANPNTQPLERMRVVELATGEELFRLDCHPTHVAFSPDGRVLVTAGPVCLQVWDAGTGAELFKLRWPEEPLTQSALSSTTSLIVRADGQAAITGMYDGTVLVWDLSAAKKPASWRRSKKLERNDLESLWADLAGDAKTCQPCVHLLAATPDQSIPFLAEKVRPVGAVDAQYLDQLVAELEGAELASREIASRTIARLGEQVEPALRRALSRKPSNETRKLLETMLAALHGPLTGETRRTARAIQVLTMIDTAESRQILQRLAAGAPDARETRLAKTALGKELH